MQLTKNFKRSEFACKCGCGFDGIDLRLVNKLQEARDLAGVPFRITSGCRCPKRNKEAGGEADSAHLLGLAADIATPTSYARYRILKALIDVGFTRIGINFAQNFVHADIDAQKPQNIIFKY